ncbi:MAG: DUF4860 domain-containing protein [Ruminococcaceae bacterium]|nr:DUF4860 domain-containing protein [Oscillospiraceae bacterium]
MNRNSLQSLFFLTLCLIFALFTLALTATAASVYENIAADMEENHMTRTALSYISTKIRQSDRVSAENGQIITDEDGFISRIYYFNGAIMEYFGEEDAEFQPDYGYEIAAAESLEVTEENHRIYINIGINNRVYPLIFAKNR